MRNHIVNFYWKNEAKKPNLAPQRTPFLDGESPPGANELPLESELTQTDFGDITKASQSQDETGGLPFSSMSLVAMGPGTPTDGHHSLHQ